MKCALVMVPPGGGETDYQLEFELPSIPRPGDRIRIKREDREYGYECFIVRSVWWDLSYPDSKAYGSSGPGKLDMVLVECEFARADHMTEEHKRACDSYEATGHDVQSFDVTMY